MVDYRGSAAWSVPLRSSVGILVLILHCVTAYPEEVQESGESSEEHVIQYEHGVLLDDWLVEGPLPEKSLIGVDAGKRHIRDDLYNLSPFFPFNAQVQVWRCTAVVRVDDATSLDLVYDSYSGAVVWLNNVKVHEDKSRDFNNVKQRRAEGLLFEQGLNRLVIELKGHKDKAKLLSRLVATDATRRIQVEWQGMDATFKAYAHLTDEEGRTTGVYSFSKSRQEYRSPVFVPEDIATRSRKIAFGYSKAIPDTAPTGLRYVDRVKFTLPGRLSFRGRIVDASTGSPLASGRICLLKWFRTPPVREWVETDTRGRFVMDGLMPGRKWFYVEADGYASVLREIDPAGHVADESSTFRLNRGCTAIEAKVLDTAGHPVRGATFSGEIAFNSQAKRVTRMAVTDFDGVFRWQGGARDEYPVENSWRKLSYRIDHPDFEVNDDIQPVLSPEKVWAATITLLRRPVIEGVVLDSTTWRSVAEASVFLKGNGIFQRNVSVQTVTSSTGYFTMSRLGSGNVDIYCHHPDFAPSVLRATLADDVITSATFELNAGIDLYGQVVDELGEPLAGVEVGTRRDADPHKLERHVMTESEGQFVLVHLPDEPIKAFARKEGYQSGDFKIMPGQGEAVLELHRIFDHTVRVRLSDSEDPPEEVRVFMSKWKSNVPSMQWSLLEEKYASQIWDSSTATLTLSNDTGFMKSFRFLIAGYDEGVVDRPEDATESQHLELVLEPATSMPGKVIDAKTEVPIEGAVVLLGSETDMETAKEMVSHFGSVEKPNADGFPGTWAVSGVDGTFEITRIDRETHNTIFVYDPRGGSHLIAGADAFLKEGRLDLPVPAPGRITGRVLAGLSPMPGSRLSLLPYTMGDFKFPSSLRIRRFNVDEDGVFQLDGITPGVYELHRTPDGYYQAWKGSNLKQGVTRFAVAPGSTVIQNVVVPAGYTISGHVFDPDGKPAPNCTVSVDTPVDATSTDKEGAFSLPHIPPGTHRLKAEVKERPWTDTYYVSFSFVVEPILMARAVKDVTVSSDLTVDLHLVRLRPAKKDEAEESTTPTPTVVPEAKAKKPRKVWKTALPEMNLPIWNSDETLSLSRLVGRSVVFRQWNNWGDGSIKGLREALRFNRQFRDRSDILVVLLATKPDGAMLDEVIAECGMDVRVIDEAEIPDDLAEARRNVRKSVVGKDGLLWHGDDALELALSEGGDVDADSQGVVIVDAHYGEDGVRVLRAKVQIDVIGEKGATLSTETYSLAERIGQGRCYYRRSSGLASLRVVVSALDCEERRIDIPHPDTVEEISLEYDSPSSISGVCLVQGTLEPVRGVVVCTEVDRIVRSATTDELGRFTLPNTRSGYWPNLLPKANQEFAPIEPSCPIVYEEDKPLAKQTIWYAKAVTIHGKVYTPEGEPASGAKVSSNLAVESTTSDVNGSFQLKGISKYAVGDIHAASSSTYAKLSIDKPDPDTEYLLQLGEAFNRSRPVVAGSVVEPIKGISLPSGLETLWRPEKTRPTIVVFCALWHPEARELLEKARVQAIELNYGFAAFSIDWDLAQAYRHLSDISAGTSLIFAGPGGLEIADDWNINSHAHAYLVSAAGRIERIPNLSRVLEDDLAAWR